MFIAIERLLLYLTWMNDEVVYMRIGHIQRIRTASYVTNSDFDRRLIGTKVYRGNYGSCIFTYYIVI